MTNIIIVDSANKTRNYETESYSIKELLQLLKSKNNNIKTGQGVPKILCSINVDNFVFQIIGWNKGIVEDINNSMNQLISHNMNKRTKSQIHGNYYGDLVVLKTTLSTKILDLPLSTYSQLIEKLLDNPITKPKRTLKLKAKYGLTNDEELTIKDSDDEDDDEDDDENDDNELDEDDEEDDEDDDDFDSDYMEKTHLSKKFKILNDDEEEDDDEDDDDDVDNEEEEMDKLEDNDDVGDEVEVDYSEMAVVKEKKPKGKIVKKKLDLDSFGDILNIEIKNTFTKNLNEIRSKTIGILHDLLKEKRKINSIEQGVYNYCIEMSIQSDVIPRWDNQVFRNMYINKVRSIYTNLKKQSYVNNNNFIAKLKNGDIDPYQIAYMKPYEIFPEQWEKVREEEYQKNKLLYLTKPEAMTDIHKCKRCKKRETSYFELQIRSADEPATMFITCVNCGNQWTKNP